MNLMTTGTSTLPAEHESRQLVSDLFHQLSQPLTTLCCTLELAQLQTPTVEQYGVIVDQALGQTEKVASLVTAIRSLFDAGQAGEDGEVLDFRRAVEDAISDFLPVAESAGVQVHYVPGPPSQVCFDLPRLRQGLFHLIGFAIGSASEKVVDINLANRGTETVLQLTISGAGAYDRLPTTNSDQELLRRLGLGIACAIFEAAGGHFRMDRRSEYLSIEVQLLRDEVR
jgi:signal transduction histidine kinase